MSEPVSLITGTSKGIGKFLAKHYCEQGHIVIGCSRNDAEWTAPGYEHFVADVTDERQVRAVFSAVRRSYGRLDNLVNNAGIASMNHSLLTPSATVSKVMQTNVLGTFLFCREAAKQMKKANYGRIINFSTVAVPLKLAGEAVYVASKAAVEGLTDVLAKEFAPFGITVNTIGPVPIETDLIRSVPGEKIAEIIDLQSIKRLGTFADVANVTDFFLASDSEFITGQKIYLGGL